jgi:hypothetical protein
VKIFFKNEDVIMTFLIQKKMEDYIASRPMLQKRLKKVLQAEGKQYPDGIMDLYKEINSNDVCMYIFIFCLNLFKSNGVFRKIIKICATQNMYVKCMTKL